VATDLFFTFSVHFYVKKFGFFIYFLYLCSKYMKTELSIKMMDRFRIFFEGKSAASQQ
jgi:hypothetical protein